MKKAETIKLKNYVFYNIFVICITGNIDSLQAPISMFVMYTNSFFLLTNTGLQSSKNTNQGPHS